MTEMLKLDLLTENMEDGICNKKNQRPNAKSFKMRSQCRGMGAKLTCFYKVLQFSQSKFYYYSSYLILSLCLASTSTSFIMQQTSINNGVLPSAKLRLIVVFALTAISGCVPVFLVATGLNVLREMRLSQSIMMDLGMWFFDTLCLAVLCVDDLAFVSPYTKQYLAGATLLTALRLNTHNVTMSGLSRVYDVVGENMQDGYRIDAQDVWNTIRKASISPSAKAVMERSLENTQMDRNGTISARQYMALFNLFRSTLRWRHATERNRKSVDMALARIVQENPTISIGNNNPKGLKRCLTATQKNEEDARENLLAELFDLMREGKGSREEEFSMWVTFMKSMGLLMRDQKMTASLSITCMVLFACCMPLQAYLAGEMVRMCNARGVATPDEHDKDQGKFFTYFGVIIGLYFFSDVMSYTYLYLWGKMGGNSVRRIQMEMIQKVCIGDTTFGDKFRPGKLGSRFSSSLAGIFTLWTNGAQFIALPPILLMVAFGFMGTVSTAYVIFSFGAIPFILSLEFLSKRSLSSSRKNVTAMGIIFGAFQNTVDMRDALRTCDGSTEYLLENLAHPADQAGKSWAHSFHWTLYLQNTFNSVAWGFQCISTCTFLLALWNEVIQLDEFVAIQGYVAAATVPMFQVGIGARFITSAAGDVIAILEILNCPDVEDRKKGAKMKVIEGKGFAVSIENVSFRYTPEGPLVLKGITANIEAGSYVVLCGGSGSGKSTLLSILMRFRDAAGGRVCINGQDISKTSLESFRQSSSVVFQTTLILDGSIAENIAFGLEGDDIRERVEQAARDAEIYDTIVATPDGFETQIGKRSTVNLSGGQLQRICIARALARKPKVMLLDEATSALDPITETSIIQTLERLREASKGQLTIISVSHHPLTALNADNIFVMEDGQIAETGTFESLVASGGRFADLVDSTK